MKKAQKNPKKQNKKPPNLGGVGTMPVNTVPTKLFWWLIFFRAFLFSFPNVVSSPGGFYRVLACHPSKCGMMYDVKGRRERKSV